MILLKKDYTFKSSDCSFSEINLTDCLKMLNSQKRIVLNNIISKSLLKTLYIYIKINIDIAFNDIKVFGVVF